MTCLACAERGHATRTGKMSVRCPVAGTPRLVGQNCAYSEGAIWAHVEAARDRLKLLESLHAWAHAKAEEAAYWDAAANPDRAGAVHGYTSQPGKRAATSYATLTASRSARLRCGARSRRRWRRGLCGR